LLVRSFFFPSLYTNLLALLSPAANKLLQRQTNERSIWRTDNFQLESQLYWVWVRCPSSLPFSLEQTDPFAFFVYSKPATNMTSPTPARRKARKKKPKCSRRKKPIVKRSG
jgi:hypothetical protein